MKQVVTHSDLRVYFDQKVKEALKIQRLSVSADVQVYLTHILTDFAKSEKLYIYSQNGQVEDRALALRLHDSVFSGSSAKKFRHLKSLADTALYQAGVFYEGLMRQAVNVDYYIQMGGLAYNSLANLSTIRNHAISDIFSELSQEFKGLVEIIKLCCESEDVVTDADLLQLIDRYLKTGSLKAKQILMEKGILPHLEIEE